MLTEAIDAYLGLRRSLGFALGVDGFLLASFARFAASREEHLVRTRTAIEWATLAPSPGQRDRRLSCVRRFAIHALGDDPNHEVPPRRVFVSTRNRRRPHILTPGELQRILEACSELRPIGSLRPLTFKTLFGLLASTGLRISEALNLEFRDLGDDGLVVRGSKFRKSRLVPLHETTRAELDRYIGVRRRIGGPSDRVFVSLRRRALSYPTTVATYLQILRSIGLHPGPGKLGPRIHDLRHTFAVRSLEACPAGRREVGRHLLALSTYIGHAHVDDTYWYLTATPHLMSDIADACEKLSQEGR